MSTQRAPLQKQRSIGGKLAFCSKNLREASVERPDFLVDLGNTLEMCRTKGTIASLILVSIDHLDFINTTFGHRTGNKVLADARDELISAVRSGDSVWRFSGSKFAVLLRHCSEDEVRIAGRRFRDTMAKKLYKTDAGPISVTCSVGAVMVPQYATNIDDARMHALIAVEQARNDRWMGVALYQPDTDRDQRRTDDAATAQSVIAAIAQNRLRLAYQPIAHAKTGELAFYEALIRIVAADGSLMDAADFVSAAERLGLIGLVDHAALDMALITLQNERVPLSINISVDTCHDAAWLGKLSAAIEQNPYIAPLLIVEITESQAAIHLEEIKLLVDALKALGCRVAIDDFGAGYTSFRSLKVLPVDIIKIDGSFAVDLDQNPQNQIFIQSLVMIAKAIGAQTVVEWVDGPEAAKLLADWEIDYLQGYGIGKPVMELPEAGLTAAKQKRA